LESAQIWPASSVIFNYLFIAFNNCLTLFNYLIGVRKRYPLSVFLRKFHRSIYFCRPGKVQNAREIIIYSDQNTSKVAPKVETKLIYSRLVISQLKIARFASKQRLSSASCPSNSQSCEARKSTRQFSLWVRLSARRLFAAKATYGGLRERRTQEIII